MRPATEGPELLELAAADLQAENRAFTCRNLFHAVTRTAMRVGASGDLDFEAFRAGPLAARLKRGPLPGLLPEVARLDRVVRLPREWDAYFPACILVVDRAALIPLFAASGVILQARMAVVALDGTPASVVSWLCRGLRAGHRAPIGYLHDARTVVYPFVSEPLATWARLRDRREEGEFRDLGLPPQGLSGDRFGLKGAAVFEVEAPPPHAMIAYATRALLAMLPPDPILLPLAPRPGGRPPSSEVAND